MYVSKSKQFVIREGVGYVKTQLTAYNTTVTYPTPSPSLNAYNTRGMMHLKKQLVSFSKFR